jgi:riboflavin synthase
MFTGIITDLGKVREVRRAAAGADTRLVFETGYETTTIDIGASIACSGACLTVVDKGAGWFAADISAETLECTTLGDWSAGTKVNLERPLRLGDELGGHMVSGHVDATARIVSREPESGSLRFVIETPPEIAGFIAAKGSVALDGVSLTVNESRGGQFGVNIIPHTQMRTAFGERAAGDRLNLEVDVLARYVSRRLEKD